LSIRITEKTTTRETPFILTYGSKVVLPVEAALHTHRLTTFQEALNNTALREALDLLPSVRGDAFLRETLYKLRVARLHDRTVKFHLINMVDLVLQTTEAVARSGEHGKLIINWEGPYKVRKQVRPCTYRLATSHGTSIPKTWHSSNPHKRHHQQLPYFVRLTPCTFNILP